MGYYMNRYKYIKNGVNFYYPILLLFMLLLSNVLRSQEITADTLIFLKAQEKFDSCNSGVMNYKLNHVIPNEELYWDVELSFIKSDEDKIFFYIKQYQDTLRSEYVFYNDTLLIFADYGNGPTYSKRHTHKPFADDMRRDFTFLLDEYYLTHFLSFDNIRLFDTILFPDQDSVIVAESSAFRIHYDGQINAHYNSKIILNKNNNNLVSCFNDIVAYKNDILFHKEHKEYIIDTISLHRGKNKDIEDKIKMKYRELDGIIAINTQIEKIHFRKDTLNTFSGMSHSQDRNVDSLVFFKAQQEIDSCRSGIIDYRLNYVTSNLEFYWDVKLSFIKNDDDKLFFYIKQYQDTLKSEYVFYNDTLLIFADYGNGPTYSKHYTNKPFTDDIRCVFTFLLDEYNLTNFLSYDKVKLYDTILFPNQDSVIVAEASTFSIHHDGQINAHYNSKIILNKNNNNLMSCFYNMTAYQNEVLFHKGYEEHIIDTISLHREKNKDIEDKIKMKYRELDGIISLNTQIDKIHLRKDTLNTFSNLLDSREKNVDTLLFFNAQQKLDSSRSGLMNYRLNYVTSNFELYWDVELSFIKSDSDEDKIFFYIKQYEDTLVSEYVFYNDTLLTFAEYNNEITHSKRHTNKPFSGNIRRVFTYLIDGQHNLTNFLSYDKVKLSDTVLSPEQSSVIVGEASSYKEDNVNNINAHYNSRIVINKNNNNLVSCFNEVLAYQDGAFFHKASQEYIIDSIFLYREKNKDIEDKIKIKYRELDSIIVPNIKEEKVSLKKDTLIEIPKYAYEWELPLVNGGTLSSKVINSKILVLDFYYMGCAPCIMAIPDLIRLDSLYNEKDVTFVGVNAVDKDLITINKFLEDKNIKYKNVINGNTLSDKYGFNSFPRILFIDTKTNEILYHFAGYRSDGFDHYKKLLDELLDKINKN